MNSILLIIADTSGSMYEMGKIHIQKNLCRSVHELKDMNPRLYTGVDFRFYRWAEDITAIPIGSDGSIEPLTANGQADSGALAQFLLHETAVHKAFSVLILSDGNVNADDIKRFRVQLEAAEAVRIGAVAVGADADYYKLKQVTMHGFVYAAEDIDTAVQTILFSDWPVTPPLSAEDILSVQPSETEDDWDAD